MSEHDRDPGRLETMEPNPVWDATAYEEEVAVLESVADDVVVKVWGGDWCKDCRRQLPEFGAALEAAGVDRVEHHPVEKAEDGSKVGPLVEEYGIERIPTVVVERVAERREATDGSSAERGSADRSSERSPEEDGEPAGREELARFVEEADVPILVHLARQLA